MIYGGLSPIPGVSAGTLAIMLNVYEDFFSSVSFKTVFTSKMLVFYAVAGAVIGLFGVAAFMSFLLERFRQILLFSFIGLILGCAPMIFGKARLGGVGAKKLIVFGVALALMLFLAFGDEYFGANLSLEELGGISVSLAAWLLMASIIAAIAALAPGPGGSAALLALGSYTVFIEALSTFNSQLLVILGLGFVLGTLIGVWLTKVLLKSHAQLLYSAILALILGSAFIIFPGFSADLNGVLSIVFALLFAILAYFLSNPKKA